MSRNVAIVIPAKDEEASIKAVIDDIRAHYAAAEIIVIDDCSSDSTFALLKSLNLTAIRHLENRGAWQATQTGMLYAYEKGYKYVLTMDADGQHSAAESKVLLETIERDSDIDMVVGSCVQRGTGAKKLAWRLFRAIGGIAIEDVTSGFRVYNRAALAVLTSEQAALLEYQDVGVLLLLKSAGLKYIEIPVTINARMAGHSRLFHSWFKIGFYMISTLLLSLSKSAPENRAKLFRRLK
ncbi:MAG: glycosyltransferase family 2 protein [Aestuariibacter sp.]